jgi:hypothetical protein
MERFQHGNSIIISPYACAPACGHGKHVPVRHGLQRDVLCMGSLDTTVWYAKSGEAEGPFGRDWNHDLQEVRRLSTVAMSLPCGVAGVWLHMLRALHISAAARALPAMVPCPACTADVEVRARRPSLIATARRRCCDICFTRAYAISCQDCSSCQAGPRMTGTSCKSKSMAHMGTCMRPWCGRDGAAYTLHPAATIVNSRGCLQQ